MADQRRAFIAISVAYAVAIVLAAAIVVSSPLSGSLTDVLLADVAATLVVFGFSITRRNSSFYDAYWSVAPPLLLLGWIVLHSTPLAGRIIVVGVLVVAWSVRLTRNWAMGWRGLDHADWRYVRLKEQLGVVYWPVSLIGIHLMPTLIVFLGCLPLYVVTLSSRPLNAWDACGVLLGVVSIWLESRADRELRDFRGVRASPADVLDSGVWSWCRHPNYAGEIGFWIALGCFGLAASPDVHWQLIGIGAMVVLFLGVSVPMIERKLSEDKPGYASYRERVPMLLPRPRPGK